MVLQLQRDKESKGFRASSSSPGPAASQPQPRLSVCLSVPAVLFGVQSKSQHCPVLQAERCSFT